MQAVEARFWSKVNFDGPLPERAPELGPCWLWAAQRDKDGYGRFRPGGKANSLPAHRIAFALFYGWWPPEHTDHLCDTPACIHPLHLKAATARENVLRSRGLAAVNAAKTECKRGHPLAGGNLHLKVNKRGNVSRRCQRCHRDAARAAYTPR